MMRHLLPLLALVVCLSAARAEDADLILHNGKIVTVDKKFTIHKAIAVRGNRILKVGSDADVLKTKGDKTTVIDLAGKMVMPGLIDSHVHPTSACMTEFDHEIPDMESIDDVLAYVEGAGRQGFRGRVDQHEPDLHHASEGAALSRRATNWTARRRRTRSSSPPGRMRRSTRSPSRRARSTRTSRSPTAAPATSKKTRTASRPASCGAARAYIRSQGSGRKASELDRTERLLQLFKDYNSVGLTAIADRDAGRGDISRYRETARESEADAADRRLPPRRHHRRHRLHQENHSENRPGPACQEGPLAAHRRHQDLSRRRHAYRLAPTCASRGASARSTRSTIRNTAACSSSRRNGCCRSCRRRWNPNLQFTAHSVGDGAVHTLLDVYSEINEKIAGGEDPPLHHAFELHEQGGSREGGEARRRRGHPAGLALPRHAARSRLSSATTGSVIFSR